VIGEKTNIPDLLDLIDPTTIKVHAPTLVVFVCGGLIEKIDKPPKSLRDAFVRIADKSPLAKYRIVLAEEIEAFFPKGVYQELLRFESDIAQIAELLLLFSESAGSLAELGAFSTDEEVAPRMMVVIDDANYKSDSFIKLGPLYSLTLHHGDAAVCVIALKDIDLDDWAAAGFEDTEIRCFYGTGGGSWRDASIRRSSRLRLFD
jgi:hypothetical protein